MIHEEQVLAYLKAECRGRKNRKKSRQIEASLHISGNELRKQVNRLRRKGNPIASSREGYFFAVTAGEIYSTICQLKRMERGLQSAINGLEYSLRAYPEIRRAQIAQQIFCCARRFDAGILCVFQVKSTRHSGKDASKMCADNFRIGS